MDFIHSLPHDTLMSIAVLGMIILATIGACYVGFFILGQVARRIPVPLLDAALREMRSPILLLLTSLTAGAVLPLLNLGSRLHAPAAHLLEIFFIFAVAWLCLRTFDTWRRLLALRYPLDVEDNLHARQIHTQVQMLRRIALILISVVAIAVMLMTFPEVRTIGATLFASAGVVGLVVGLAARPAITNVLAGLQVALTEPIRIDDVVVVEGEWGYIEEIRTSYVVVRIWDLRRLVLPLSYFIEKPFQNWTRRSADILGTVFIYADYTVPVDAVREELHRILKTTPLWDGKSWGLQVTDATAQTVELRALMSAANGSAAWNLRCLVREALIGYLQARYPGSLPQTRVQLDRPDPGR